MQRSAFRDALLDECLSVKLFRGQEEFNIMGYYGHVYYRDARLPSRLSPYVYQSVASRHCLPDTHMCVFADVWGNHYPIKVKAWDTYLCMYCLGVAGKTCICPVTRNDLIDPIAVFWAKRRGICSWCRSLELNLCRAITATYCFRELPFASSYDSFDCWCAPSLGLLKLYRNV